MKNKLIPVVLFGVLFLLGGCKVLDQDDPPYVISKPISVIGSKTGFYQFAAITFDFYNKSDKDISSIKVSFIVYDSVTKTNPLIGSNLIKVDYSGLITANTKKSLIIPLDSYIYVAPTTPYVIDFFYVAKITYSDGSTWEDPNGLYYTGSN